MGVVINFDRRAFSRVAEEAAQQAVRDLQRVFDRVYREYSGKPVESVRRALATACRQAGISMDGKQLDSSSETISGSTRVVLRRR